MKHPLAAAVFAALAFCTEPVYPGTPIPGTKASQPAPYPLLNPPKGVTPAQTRGWFPWTPDSIHLPAQSWNAEERRAYEARVEWFHQAKFGVFVHFLAFGDRARDSRKNWMPAPTDWTSDSWNQAVEAVDVEKFADQVKELGAGYVVLTLGQNHQYACAPNPVMDELWGFQPGQFNSRRDLPMELGKALGKRGVALMLYVVASGAHKLPPPPDWGKEQTQDNWIKVVQWYSDHYGALCKGWWVDGISGGNSTSIRPLTNRKTTENDFAIRLTRALKHGNPDTLVGSGCYELSDYVHGHCIGSEWEKQRKFARPFFGRWDPDFNIQWQALLYLGNYWGAPEARMKTEELVSYASDIVKGGGVITFDVGGYKVIHGKTTPSLDIPELQQAQLRAVRDAVSKIPVSDGSGQ